MRREMKWTFYFRHLILMATVNKTRTVLTVLGIFVSVFIFSTGLIITESYYNGCLEIANDISDNTIIVKPGENTSSFKKEISEITSQVPIGVQLLSEQTVIFSSKLDSVQSLTVMANIQGVSDLKYTLPILTDEGVNLPVVSSLNEGRFFTSSDNNSREKVVIIDELTADLLFPNESALGQSIELGVAVNDVTMVGEDKKENIVFEVVGVVENSHLTETRKVVLKSDIDLKKENIYLNTSIYVPIATLTELFPDSEKEKYYIYSFDDERQFLDVSSKVSGVHMINNSIIESFLTKESMISDLEEQLSNTKRLLNLISIVLCTISGISIMSITFFSVKERIPEIGIRKAFGATKLDIAFQFVFEMMFIAFFTSVFSVCISYFACKLAEKYIVDYLFIAFTISIKNELLLLPVLLGVFEAMLCSIPPSFYATQIKVTDSLKFE